MSFGRIFIATALVALLAACSTTHAPQSSSGSSPSSRGPEILPPSAPGTAPAITEQGSVPRVEKPARGANRPYTVLGRHYVPITGDKPMRERGIASWYGKQFHGKKTSNGEVFDMYSVSAAHKTMELPSYARVTNLENGRSMIIRINDRGPFYGDRIIGVCCQRNGPGRSGADHDGGNRGRHLEPHGYCFEHYPGDAGNRWHRTRSADHPRPPEHALVGAGRGFLES